MNEYSKFQLTIDKKTPLNVIVYDPSKEKKTGDLADVGAIHHIHVLDRSGSMSGSIDELIDNVQKSFEHIEDDDYLTVIWFSSQNQFRTVIKAAKKTDNIKSMLDSLRSVVGATCFSDPMKEVNAIIDELYGLCPNISVTLFTDGQPVVPWSDAEEYKRVLAEAEKMKGKVLAINTVGYGNYYNQDFLKQLSSISQFGIMTHSKKIDEYFDIFEENKASVSGMVNQKTEVTAGYGNILYLGPKTCKLEVTSLIQRQRSKTKNIYFVFGDLKNGVAINGKAIPKVDEASDEATIQDFVYAYAYQLYYTNQRKDALDLIVKVAGDKVLADSMMNAFTFDEVAACTELLKNAVYETSARNAGTCKPNYIPADDAPCVMDLIADLAKEEAKYVPFSKNVESYKRIGRKVEDSFNCFKMNEGEVLAPLDKLIYSSEKLNVSTAFTVPGVVSLNPKEAKKVKLDEQIPSQIYNTHTIVKDGNLNIKQMEVDLSRISASHIANKYGSNVVKEIAKDRFIIDLTKLPIINHSYVNKSKNMDNIYANVLELNKLEAKQKVVKYYIDKVMDEGVSVLKKENAFKDYTMEQIEVLEKHGLDSKLNYKGVSRVAPKVDECDYYEAREIEFVLKGVSSLPKIDDYLKKKAENKITTLSLKLMHEAYTWLESLKIDLTSAKARTKDQLEKALKEVKTSISTLRNELNALKLAKILTGDWFQDLKTDDKGNFYYDKGDITMLVKANRSKVYITPGA